MFGRRPKFRNFWEEEKYNRFNLWAFIIIAVIFSFMIIRHIVHVKRLSGKERQSALAESADDYQQRRKIEEFHEKCFFYNYRRVSRSNPEFFDRKEYRNCLETGTEAWLEKRRAMREAEQKEYEELQKALR